MTFCCRADDVSQKCVEQSRFEQMHFEQLTLTQNNVLIKMHLFRIRFTVDLLVDLIFFKDSVNVNVTAEIHKYE
jgi:hypothetical protein